MTPSSLPELITRSARARPDHPAIEEPPAWSISYRDLDLLSDRVRDRLRALGVGRGDRVAILAGKSIDAVAALLGAMKAGAAYVPIDPAAPAWRAAAIFANCTPRVAVAERTLAHAVRGEFAALGAPEPVWLELDGAGGGDALTACLDRAAGTAPSPAAPAAAGLDDMACILHTSGSTGVPKGVVLTHRSALSFLDWCSATFAPRPDDRFSSHAPLHFDLSVLDLYLPFAHGGTVVLIGPEAGREPVGLASLIAERRLTVWYSAPSALAMLAEFGRLERHHFALRLVLFAGEVFPVKHLRTLTERIPGPRYFNLYGPTETNVCTCYEVVAPVPPERTAPYPIGTVCPHLRGRVVDSDGRDVADVTEGELVISGPNVMQGYWNMPDATVQAFLVDAAGTRWYRTGDVVARESASANLVFLGRRDRMVKRRGHRIELGDVEAGLYRHPRVREVAIIAREDADAGIRLRAFLSFTAGPRPTIVEMKGFAARALPAAMVPDEFVFLDTLPKSSTDKIDYLKLRGELMDFALTPEQQALRDQVVRFAQRELNDGIPARDREGVFAPDLWRRCGAQGLLGLPVDTAYGGVGLDPLSCAIALEALGYGCRDSGLVFSVCAHLLSCVVPIWKHGSDAQRKRWLPGLCDGSLVGVHAMTEPGSGSDAFALRTTAVADGAGWRISGVKTFVTNGPVADVVIVFASTDAAKGFHGGVTAFVLGKETPGLNTTRSIQKMGLRTSPFGELVLEDARVGAECVLGEVGAGGAIFVQSMDWERACLFASHVGTMDRLIETSVAYARTRPQFGQPIGKFQAIAHRIADMKVRVEAARLLAYRAAWMLDRSRAVTLDAAIAKLAVSEALVQTALDTLQIHGGYGYCTEYEVERAVRDALGSTIYSGTSEMQRQIIARWLGL